MIVLGALAVVAAAIVSLEGWGRLVVAGVVKYSGEEPGWDQPGVRGAIGVAVISSLIGFLVLVRVPAEIPFLILAATGLVGWLIRPPPNPLRRDQLRANGLRLSLLALLAAWLLIWILAAPAFNPCDDDVAYLPFAHEILHVGGLHEPFSQRRIGTLGSWIPIQFWGYPILGTYGSLLGEAVICPLLAAMAMLWSTRNRWGIAIAIAGAIVASLAGLGRANLGPSAISVLMLVCAGLIAGRGGGNNRSRLAAAVVVSLVAAQLIGYRPHYGLVALVPVAAVVLWPPRRLRVSLYAAATLVVALLGWSLSSWRDVGTPLFPILGKGTLNPDWKGLTNPAVHGFDALSDRSIDLLRFSSLGARTMALVVGAGMLAAGALLLHRRNISARQSTVASAMALATLATIAIFPIAVTSADTFDAWRLNQPLLAAALLLLLVAAANAMPARVGFRLGYGLSIPMLAISLALAIWVGQVDWSLQWDRIRTLKSGVNHAADFNTDPYANLRYPYDVLKRYIPNDARVAYAVDQPALLEGAGQTAYNLDVLGANSPSPGMPFFKGPQALLNYLRDQGIGYLVTIDPTRSACLYNRHLWVMRSRPPDDVYDRWAPYFEDWFGDYRRLTSSRTTTRFDVLRLTRIPLSSPARQPSAAASAAGD